MPIPSSITFRPQDFSSLPFTVLPVTYADTTALERDFDFKPSTA